MDAKGRELDKDTQEALIPEAERLVPATPGNNLVLSVDEKLQRLADTAFAGRAAAGMWKVTARPASTTSTRPSAP